MSSRKVSPTDKWWAKGLIHCYVCGLDVTGYGPGARKFYNQHRPGTVAYTHSSGLIGIPVECERVLLESDEWGSEHPLELAQQEFDRLHMKGITYYEGRD